MSDFLDAFSEQTLHGLRTAVLSGVAENNREIFPGLYLSWDPEEMETAPRYESPDWATLSVAYTAKAAARWVSLNLVLADGRLDAGDVLGLVIEGYASENRSFPIRLRSKFDGVTADCDWTDSIELTIENGSSVALRTLEPKDEVVGKDGYHTLLIGLPPTEFSFTIRNMRLFRMPGSLGMRSEPETLSSFAT
ncbi:MAG: hypothetical protein Kow0013_12600 [Pararhodobacter sp.]